MDLVSCIVTIPNTVEGFVKTARLIVAYNGIENKYAETIEDTIYYAEKLAYFAHFIDGAMLDNASNHHPVSEAKSPQWRETLRKAMGISKGVAEAQRIDESKLSAESQRILYDLFQKAVAALRVAQNVVLEWALRLDLIDSSAARLLVARLALSMSDRLIRLADMKGRKNTFSKMRNKLALLALGNIQIEDSKGRLKHWLTELHDILLASPNLNLRLSHVKIGDSKGPSDEGDDLLFVAIAREREHRSYPIKTIVKEDLFPSAHPLEHGTSEVLLVDEGPYEGCIIDRRNIMHFLDVGKADQVLSDTERMARLFAEEHDHLGHSIAASIGVLSCCGFCTSDPGYHDLVFRLPPDCPKPRTLRSHVLEKPRHTLNERIDFSIKLANAVLIVHSLGLVHKDICPDSVILIDSVSTHDPSAPIQRLGEPYLVAFHQARFQSSRTVPVSQAITEARARLWAGLYRHPRHLSTRAHLPFEPRDDIYSLGICLLEIAIWRSLFSWNEKQGIFECDKSVLDFSEMKYVSELAECDAWIRVRPYLRRRDLKKFAEENIPITMGNTFKEIVVECLTFGEEKPKVTDMIERQRDNIQFLQNQSINFVRHVLTRLRSLKLN